VHLARVLRLVGQVGGLLDRQRVHIGAQADGGAIRVCSTPTTPVLPTLRCTVQPNSASSRHELGSAVLLEAELGMRMQIPPPRRHLVMKRLDTIEDLHARGSATWRWIDGRDRSIMALPASTQCVQP
jgi:hypothetical protein